MVEIPEKVLEERITTDAAAQAAQLQRLVEGQQRSKIRSIFDALAPFGAEPELVICHGSGLRRIRPLPEPGLCDE